MDVLRQLSLESERAGLPMFKKFDLLEQGFLDGRPTVQLFDVYFGESHILKQFGRVSCGVVEEPHF